ncbi:hypothetical protein IFM89_013429 [Coptis chinensis]|uniref:Glutamate synthase n=1 Tax=Coptis chinensis TaxID=261450 RepID=A0A835LDL6_9MAGN|nr:hypothetical protein IFM89_013429 [Coptis chinensis]
MHFCQSFMNELYRYLGPDQDLPAEDMGVGLREMGYLFRQYRRLAGHFQVATVQGNHKNIFNDSRVLWSEYRYYDPKIVGLDFSGMISDVKGGSAHLSFSSTCIVFSLYPLIFSDHAMACTWIIRREGILSEASHLLDIGLLPNSNSATRAIGYRQGILVASIGRLFGVSMIAAIGVGLLLAHGGEFAFVAFGEAVNQNPIFLAVGKGNHVFLGESFLRGHSKKDWKTLGSSNSDLEVLRDLLEFKSDRPSIPVGKVEFAASIVQCFCTGGMSLGAISRETPIRWSPLTDVVDGYSSTLPHLKGLQNGDTATSAIKQVASGRFGVTPTFLVNADQLEIKIAQGAKPGEGGQLPGKKVNAYIARLRNSKPGVPLISPPPHHDIYSIEDLAQLIYDLHQVFVKLVAEAGIGTVASGVAKGNADIIQTLIENGLREMVTIRVDGGFKSGVDALMATAMGADEYGFAQWQ